MKNGLKKVNQMSKTVFCAAPWNHLHITAIKTMGLCCVADMLKDNKSSTFEDHWNSDQMKTIRLQMLDNNPPRDICHNCVVDQNAVNSQYVFHNIRAKDSIEEMIEKTSIDGHTTYLPKTIDIRTNLCNLKCRTCGEESSSSIRAENLKFKIPVSTFGPVNLDMPNDIGITDEVIQNVKQIVWAGGEPFMSPVHWDIMDRLIKCGNTDVDIWYNSNLTFPGKTLSKGISLLKNFSNVAIGASLDGTGEIGEYIRDGLDYKEFKRNLIEIKKSVKTVKIAFTATSIGLLTLEDILKLCVETGCIFNGKIARFYPSSNHPLLIHTLNYDVLDSILERSKKFSIGTSVEKDFEQFNSLIRKKFSPVVPDMNYWISQEQKRGKVGFFETRMKGLLNE